MSTFKRKPKTQKGKRVLKNRESKLVENEKGCLFLKGPSMSDMITKLIRDLHKLKGSQSKMFSRRNMTRPFEDASSMEFFSRTNDTSLFVYGSHSKKRPNNLVFGRLFDHQLLDMMEFEIHANSYKSTQECSRERKALVHINAKPMFCFLGDDFEHKPNFRMFKSYVVDFFQGQTVDQLNMMNLKRVIIVSSVNERIYFKHCAVLLKKSGTRYPRIELEDVGPNFEASIRRVREADADVMSAALKLPKTRKRKNIERGHMGDQVGRVHMMRQDTSKIHVTSMKKIQRAVDSRAALAQKKATKQALNEDEDSD